MAISRDVIESVRDRVDLVQLVQATVSLKQKGTNLVGLCPFHQEKTGSFNVVPHKNIFHCFGCGVGGDCFKFLQLSQGLSFYEAIKELAGQVGVEVEDKKLTEVDRRRHRQRTSLYDVCSEASRYFHTTLMTRPEGRPALDYLLARGITEETIRAFQLGFSPARWDAIQTHLHGKGFSPEVTARAGLVKWRSEDDKSRGCYDIFRGRVMVPIVDARGKVVAFGGRVLEAIAGTSDAIHADAPKYLNSPETDIYKKSRVLYGLHQARRSVQNRDRLLVVEGYFDVIALHQAGYEETVATCGTALTVEHAKLIRPLTRRVVALFDADEAGLRAAERSMPIFIAAGIEPYQLSIEGAKDPDEFIQTNGAEAFGVALAAASPLFELLLNRARKRYGSSPQGKQETVEALAPLIRQFESAARSAVIGRVGSVLGITEPVIQEWVGRARAPSISTETITPPRRNWRGSKALNQLFWLLIHHNDLVASTLVNADPDPDLITDYPPAKQAFALFLDGRLVADVLDFIKDENLRAVLLAAASMDSLIPKDKAVNAAKQNLDTLEIRHIDATLLVVGQAIAGCNISDDESSYFSLLKKRQALQQRRDAIRNRFAR
jgi:DNA primase